MTSTRSRLVIALTGLAVLVAAVAAVATVVTWGTPSSQCDNMAGTCIRFRQQWAIAGVRLGCAVAVLLPLGIAGATWRRERAAALRRRHLVLAPALALVGLWGSFAVWALVADPVDHLNDRWGGWLAAEGDRAYSAAIVASPPPGT